MNGSWEPGNWKWPVKILTGIATIWPPIYLVLFMVIIFSFFLFASLKERTGPDTQTINVIQLDRKIRNGEIKQLTITRDEIVGIDQAGVRYRTSNVNESVRQDILSAAIEKDESGQPRVSKVEEDTATPPKAWPFAFAGIFGAHFLTILLMLALMPFYIILAVKNGRVDHTTRIVWIVLMSTVTMFAAPVYWYLYIWRKPPPVAPALMPQAS